jgi:hypothetical protein
MGIVLFHYDKVEVIIQWLPVYYSSTALISSKAIAVLTIIAFKLLVKMSVQ